MSKKQTNGKKKHKRRNRKLSEFEKLSIGLGLVSFLIIFGTIIGVVVAGGQTVDTPDIDDIGAVENGENIQKDVKDPADEVLEGLGIDPKDLNKEITTSGGVLTGDVAKTVKQYRTLAEAEEDMGYYLGLHNDIESHPELQLVGMYNIGNGAWYQAAYESSSNKISGITVKTSNKTDIKQLIAPYNVGEYKNKEVKNIEDIEVNFLGNESSVVNLVYFKVKNGKSYSIFTSAGNDDAVMTDIATELISNLKIMDDWK